LTMLGGRERESEKQEDSKGELRRREKKEGK
jgi:hypothetical protein